jgi:hypothetical protein
MMDIQTLERILITEALELVENKLKQINMTLAEKIKAVEDAGDLNELLRLFNRTRNAYEEVDEQRKKLFTQLEYLSRNAIPEQMAEKGVTSITLDHFRFTVNSKSTTSITDKDAGYQWLKENGHGDIIKESVNANTLAAFARSYLEEHDKDLPEFFKTSYMKYTSVTAT